MQVCISQQTQSFIYQKIYKIYKNLFLRVSIIITAKRELHVLNTGMRPACPFQPLVPVQKDLRLQGHWLSAPSICCLKDVKEVNK